MGSIRGAHLDSRMKLLVAASILSSCFLLSQGQTETSTITVETPTPDVGQSSTVNMETLPDRTKSILSTSFPLSQGQGDTITISVEPPTPQVGQSVTLKLETLPERSVSCRWYRGGPADENLILTYYVGVSESIQGPAYTGRENVSSDCSLHITNLNSSDSEIYSVMVDSPPTSEFGRVELKVVEPSLSSPAHLGSGVIALIVLGSVAVMLAFLMGLLFYFCHRVHHQREKRDSPVIPAPSFYENFHPPGQVNPDGLSGTNQTYEVLRPRDQAVYEVIKWRKDELSNFPDVGVPST